jgi:hypothetical protein
VITNHAGLYRYRLGDVVRVVGLHGQAPVIEFLHRRGTQFDVTGEKTNEEHVATAVAQLRERHPELDIDDYTSAADPAASPPRYVIYLERDPRIGGEPIDSDALERWAVEFDGLLSAANPAVVEYREAGFLGRPRLAIVESGTFARLADLAVEGDRAPSRSQLKTPRRVDGQAQIELLESAVVASA